MKRILKKSHLLVVLLAAVLLLSSVVQAATIDVTDFTIDNSAQDKTVVTWAESADEVLKAEAASASGAATMTIDCKFENAYVRYVTENRLVPSSVSEGKITFEIPGAGVYHILQGASRYTVTYNANGHGTAPEAQTNVEHGSKLTTPTAPTATGYAFQGWYKTADCAEAGKWDFEKDTVTSNVTLYAKWVKTYMVRYFNNGHGTAPLSLPNVPEGSKLTAPTPAPTAEGYTFAGWYKSRACNDEDKWNFEEHVVNANVDLYAKWTVKVTFDTNGHGTAPGKLTGLKIGTKLTPPTAPTAEGYTFAGWYTDKQFNENDKWDFDSHTVEVDTVLYAKWLKGENAADKTWTVDATDAGSLDPTVKNLSKILDAVDPAIDAHVTFTVAEVAKNDQSDIQKKMKEKANGRKLAFAELSLDMVKDGVPVENFGDENTALLQIELTFPTTNRSYFRVYRYHDDAVQILTPSANSQGEKIVVGTNKITIYAKKFSTYAIGYMEGENKPTSSITSVTVTPKTATVSKGGTRTFDAVVIGQEEYNPDVTWTVTGNKRTNTKIDANGKLTIASGETATKLTVTATSVQDSTTSGTATVTVSTDTTSPKTGDQFQMGLWIGLMVLCAGGIAALIFLKKKHK